MLRSSNNGLVEIVKGLLNISKPIIPDSRGKSSYTLQVGRVHRLRRELLFMGITEPKDQREFPNISAGYIDHFVRGFMDGIPSCCTKNGINISFQSKEFVTSLHDVLVDYANIIPKRQMSNSHFKLIGKDVEKLKDFLYADWETIEGMSIYLPEKKAAFDTYLETCDLTSKKRDWKAQELKAEATEKIEFAKQLLWGESPAGVSTILGYAHRSAFYRQFKRKVGMTPGEYKDSLKLS